MKESLSRIWNEKKGPLLNVWNEKKVFIILVLVQVLANLLVNALDLGGHAVAMATSGLILLTLSGYTTYYQRKNMLSFMLSIVLLYFNYSLVASVYWNADSLPAHFAGYSLAVLLRGINIVLIFFVSFLCALKDNSVIEKCVFLTKHSTNWLITAAGATYIALAPFLFYHTESFGTRGVASAFYEYSLIILVVILCFSGRNWKALAILMASSIWMILHGLLHGERVLALQMMIVWGLYLLLHVLSLRLIIPACIVGIFVFTIFGMYRGLSALEGNVFTSVFQSLLHGGMANDTSYAAFQTSMNVLRLEDISTIWERLWLFLKYLAYIFAGSAVPDVNLAVLALEVGWHGGGGWLPVYFDFWLGFPGVIVVGVLLGWLINKVSTLRRGKDYFNYLALYIVATSPRWYLYSPSPLTRGLLMYTLAFVGATAVHRYAKPVWTWCVGKFKEWRKK